MKALLVLLLCLPLASCSNSPDPRDEKISALEQRVSKLESSAAIKGDIDGIRESNMRDCVTVQADAVYNDAIRLNVLSRHGSTVSVPVAAVDQAMRLKQQKIDQCKLLYGSSVTHVFNPTTGKIEPVK